MAGTPAPLSPHLAERREQLVGLRIVEVVPGGPAAALTALRSDVLVDLTATPVELAA